MVPTLSISIRPPTAPRNRHVAQRHEQIELTDLAQDAHQPHADGCADHASGDQHQAHLDVDVAAPVLGDGTATEEARICIEPVPTETAGGHAHRRSSSGVSRKPPPTPNIPDRKPTAQPMLKKTATFTDISAMGR